jgi:hypothetical protein
MKQRISQLETALQGSDGSPAARTVSPGMNRPRSPRLSASSHADPVDNALGQIGFLSLNAMGHSASSARGIAERVACSSLVSEAMSLDGADPAAPRLNNAEQGRFPSSALLIGVSGDLNYDAIEWAVVIERFSDLASIYLPGISGLNCFDVFRTWQNAQRTGILSSIPKAEPETVVLAKLMLATGICMNSRSESVDLLVSTLSKDTAKTVHHLQDHALLRFLIVQIIFSLYHPLGGSAWSLIGLAMAKAISLGLHRETPSPEDANSQEQQSLLSAIYVLDRYAPSEEYVHRTEPE